MSTATAVRHEVAPDCIIHQGNVLDILPTLPERFFQCCPSSPPYYGLRNYENPPTFWPAVTYTPIAGLPPIAVPEWTGCLGNEPTPEMFVAHIVLIYRGIWRALRDDAIAWSNWGDSYNGSGGAGGDYGPGGLKEGQPRYPGRNLEGLGPKQLLGIPWRVAFALQADGWTLRSDVIWSKPNPMPESVTDRPTKAHEYIFLLSKAPTYFYDAVAIQEEAATGYNGSSFTKGKTAAVHANRGQGPRNEETGTRNKRSVWTVPTKPFPEAHFAVYPPELVAPMILAGTSPQACPHCGAPWERVVEKRPVESPDSYNGSSFNKGKTAALKDNVGKGQRYERGDTLGWQPTCSCEANDGSGKCWVLDPFHGSGTTGLVALENGRAYQGCELNPDYIAISRRRLAKGQTKFAL